MTGHETRTPSGGTLSGMSLERFGVLVEAYGARPERWPAAERPAALALLKISAEARARRDEAAALDTLLGESVVPAPAPTLADTILAQAPDPAAMERHRRPVRPGPALRAGGWLRLLLPEAADWRGAAALAASLLVGLAVGYLTPLADGGTAWTEAERQAIDMFAFGGLAAEEPSL